MQKYSLIYEELQLLQSNPTNDYKLYLVKQRATSIYRTAKKTSLYQCTDLSQDQLLNEVKILKQLNHPNVIKYYDIFLEENDVIVILQFCEQGDLRYYMQRKKEKKQLFSQKLILSWVLQMLMGLEYIHSQNIIHRLVCSQNIFMNHQGDLKLGSFGGAKMLESTLEKALTVVGSPINLSPQVVQGNPYDSKVDIWGLGCLIYELATYQHPFKMTSLPQLYEAIVKSPPQDLPVKYSKYLNPIYKKMMKKNPSFRPSASELLQEEVFIKLMKQYVKKKKIDSLGLRQVTPKQLLAHKSKQSKLNRILPPLQNTNSTLTQLKIKNPQAKRKAKQSQINSKSKQKEYKSPRLPSLSGKTSQSEQQSKQATNCSPKLIKQAKQCENLPAIQKQEKKVSPKILKPKELSSAQKLRLSSINQKQEQVKIQELAEKEQRHSTKQKQNRDRDRLTDYNIMQGEYISLLCQIKLQLLQKKYSPTMTQIFEQTVQFDQQE